MADKTVAAIAVVQVAFVVDIGIEVVRIVATAELTPKMYAVAIVAVDSLDLVVVALYSPLQHNIMHSKSNLYIYYNAIHTCQ